MSVDTEELRPIEALCRRILSDSNGADHQHAVSLDREGCAGLGSAGLTDLAAGLDGDAPSAGFRRALTVIREVDQHTKRSPSRERPPR